MSLARDGFSTLTPYITAEDAAGLLAFLESVFDAEILDRSEGADGIIGNAVARIGDSLLEVSDARDDWGPRPASIHVYVEDVDDAFTRAVDAGAEVLYEIAEMPYGERSGGVEDAWGNYWYIASATG